MKMQVDEKTEHQDSGVQALLPIAIRWSDVGFNVAASVNCESREHLKGKYHCTVDLLFDWFGISCMTVDNFCFYLQNRLIQTGQTGGQWYNYASPFSIPWSQPRLIVSLSKFKSGSSHQSLRRLLKSRFHSRLLHFTLFLNFLRQGQTSDEKVAEVRVLGGHEAAGPSGLVQGLASLQSLLSSLLSFVKLREVVDDDRNGQSDDEDAADAANRSDYFPESGHRYHVAVANSGHCNDGPPECCRY